MMSTNKETTGTIRDDIQVKTLPIPAKCGPIPSSGVSKVDVVATGPVHQVNASSVQSPQTSSPTVMVVTKVSKPGGISANHLTKAALSQASSTQGRTVVITVPRSAGPPMAVASRPAQTPLPANIQIPPGMMLIRSDSGQLMLMSQQALAQAQQGVRSGNSEPAGILTPQASTAAASQSKEKVTVIRMTAPPAFQPAAPVQKTAVVKVIGVAPKPAVVQTCSLVQPVAMETKKEPPPTFSQETLESVKKCKNFLVTLMKLASSDSNPANMANNVRGLVRSLLEGKLEVEEFTEALYQELKSTPQPCLVPFLKKSLPAVRCLTSDPQLFIQQASSSCNLAVKKPSMDTVLSPRPAQQLSSGATSLRPGFSMLAQSRTVTSKSIRPTSTAKITLVQTGKDITGAFQLKQPFVRDPPCTPRLAFRDTSASYKEDDDINDVASMAGVNLREENAQNLTSTVGSVVQSCQDQLFLSPSPVLSRILHAGRELGVTEVGPEVVSMVSHATQECLRGILEKLTVMAELRKSALKEDLWHAKVSDVRSQLRFLEEVESLKKKRKDEEERETLLRLARSRSHTEDPLHQQLKQRAKELQQIEEAQLQQREANITALAAIGPRKKRPLTQMEGQVSLLPRQGFQHVTRVILRDLLVCMEQDNFLRHSLILYKAML
ncbi:transcription initiation factor TFIID subunit 4-like isoform X2 [Dunckerocampus dactyliophorus]|uniref:transcription initiation factor TFIID subunit 4-like isoform X2 n=1 Tax=Dunckerocampus dactyliophorus TaxID=161453 RepID=UPI0024065483|nr:transcription initiation factor TFIID subunit 4-like isoform X2 [Dunckerocampus dactyliophorus]